MMPERNLKQWLDGAGELMVQVDGFDKPFELHKHDTTFENGSVTLELTDGEIQFDTDDVSGVWKHKKSLSDYDL